MTNFRYTKPNISAGLRNLYIYLDNLNGSTHTQISDRYQISKTRVSQICQHLYFQIALNELSHLDLNQLSESSVKPLFIKHVNARINKILEKHPDLMLQPSPSSGFVSLEYSVMVGSTSSALYLLYQSLGVQSQQFFEWLYPLMTINY